MKVVDAIARIKSAGHDISDEYGNERCLEFVNTAMQQVAAILIGANYPPLVKELVVRNGDSIPDNFMKACGSYPLKMTDGRAHIFDDFEQIKFRYFAIPNSLELNDELPFNHDGINEVIVKLATMLALNENEYELSQDKALLDSLQQAIAGGMASI